MRVTCPTCQAAYEVPDEKLAAGKRLRCARCGKEWHPPAAAPPPVAEVVKPVAPPYPLERPARVGPERKPAAAVHARAGTGLWAAWILTLAVLGAGTWGAYKYRAQVMQAWPPSQRAYAAIGLQ
jgi:predicted Zn finger-like uncharacterized protein